MALKLTDIATEAEIHAECVEDHSPFTYVREDGGFAISMNGFYTEHELEWALRALQEANAFYTTKDKWETRLQLVQAWKAFKQNPTPRLQTAINQLYKAMRSQV